MTTAPTTAGDHDAVTHALGGLGTLVDCTGFRSLPLEGPHVLWLVVGGALDLFAVDAAQEGHWHFLGRVETGTLLLGPVDGPLHTLLGRPSQDCRLRRIPLRELRLLEYGEQGAYASGPYAVQPHETAAVAPT
ncbi:hypothetical protein, partial [Cellulomonas iranensis]|uniref:hypothetical protein n=1 Tax=Cellulomonas iranensis TaxID=76862 RepID=UPI001C4F6A36